MEIVVQKIFDTDSDAYDVYNNYALRKGFDIRKDGLQKSRTSKLSKDITHVKRKGLRGKT